MFKRSPSHDRTPRINSERQSQLLADLNKCIYIPHDDKLVIRAKIKAKEPEVIQFFDCYRKDKILSDLQCKIRRYLQIEKGKNVEAYGEYQMTQKKFDSQRMLKSEQSLPKSQKSSLKGSPVNSAKHQKVKINISQLKKKIDNSQQMLLSKSPSKKLSIQKSWQSLRSTVQKKFKSRQTEIFCDPIQTQPELYLRENEEKQFHRSPKTHFFNQICFTEEVESLLKSKLTKRKSSTPNALSCGSKELKLFQENEYNKQNVDINTLNQNRSTPSFFTGLQANTPRMTSRGQVQIRDPRFGQFTKKIKQILNDHY